MSATATSPAADPTGGANFGTSNSGGTYPYGSTPYDSAGGSSGSAAGAPLILPSGSGVLGAEQSDGEAGGVLVKSPDGTYWRKPGAGEAQARADAEACYRYAWASTRHDQRISDDRDSAVDTLNTTRFSALRQSVKGYDQKRRLRSLMEGCMGEKGYLRL